MGQTRRKNQGFGIYLFAAIFCLAGWSVASLFVHFEDRQQLVALTKKAELISHHAEDQAAAIIALVNLYLVNTSSALEKEQGRETFVATAKSYPNIIEYLSGLALFDANGREIYSLDQFVDKDWNIDSDELLGRLEGEPDVNGNLFVYRDGYIEIFRPIKAGDGELKAILIARLNNTVLAHAIIDPEFGLSQSNILLPLDPKLLTFGNNSISADSFDKMADILSDDEHGYFIERLENSVDFGWAYHFHRIGEYPIVNLFKFSLDEAMALRGNYRQSAYGIALIFSFALALGAWLYSRERA
ncbi:MAG: hypothetical protein R3261_00315, partial [Alphaproteobacteria bacterium]|nr:hypothetical protein [Alphaproteobacteria bacterium]